MKSFVTFLSCLIGFCGTDTPEIKAPPPITNIAPEAVINFPHTQQSNAGNYLAGLHAQRQHDWTNAVRFLERTIDNNPDNTALLSKSMLMAMGSGQSNLAIRRAHDVLEHDTENMLALLFLAAKNLKENDHKKAAHFIERMPSSSLAGFVAPMMEAWNEAANGAKIKHRLDGNILHLYHTILITDFLGHKDQIEPLLQKMLKFKELSLQDLQRIADLYAYIGKTDTALSLNKKILNTWPSRREIAFKIDALKNGKPIADSAFKPITDPVQGIALALYDIARILYQEYSDESARIFSHLTLYLDPSMTDANLLLGYITARNARYDESIAYYQKVTPDNDQYLQARRMAADMLEDAGKTQEAVQELEGLYKNYQDLEALIQIGDIYRRLENFGKAVDYYNQAETFLNGTIPAEYWQIHYVRGMCYERLGKWQKAEDDLKKALKYQPDHPLVLNYLGYAWADQGVHLDQALKLIRKAALLQPTDGYIIDSLGWVMYRIGQHEEAVPYLEKAVELLPYDPTVNDHLGDVYWKVGREIEARFQWLRAKNHTKDQKLLADITAKIESGLQGSSLVQEAQSKTISSDSDL